jgi:hypothetical protein
MYESGSLLEEYPEGQEKWTYVCLVEGEKVQRVGILNPHHGRVAVPVMRKDYVEELAQQNASRGQTT